MAGLSLVDFTPSPDAKPSPFGGRTPPAATPEEARMLEEIKRRESSNNYAAKNRDSTASGAYQFINSTWRMASHETGAPYYATAAQAPEEVQDQNALHMLRKYGPNATITWAESGPYDAGKIPSKTPRSTPAPAPTSAAPTGSGSVDDLISRIAGGENIEVTPQVIAQIIQDRPKPAPAPAAPLKPEAPSFTLTSFEPAPPTPPAPTAGQEALRAGNIVAESSGLKFFTDLIGGGGEALMARLSQKDPFATPIGSGAAAEERFKGAVGGFAGMVRDEPARVRQELIDSGTALAKGDINTAADHLWFAIPFLGAAGAKMKEYLDKGDVLGAFAHATGTLGGAVATAPESRAAVAETVAKIPEVVEQVPKAAAAVVKAPVKVAGKAAGSALDVVGNLDPAVREAVGVFSPRAKHVLDLAARAKKAKDAFQESRAAGTAAAEPQAAAPVAETAPTEPVTPAGAPTDEALLHLYSVERDPAKRTALRQQMVDRGLVQEPGTTPEQNPYRDYSQPALQKTYAVETNPDKRVLIEQAARDRNLTLHTRETRRATTAVPETGSAETRGPSLTQDEALMLRHLGIEDPLAADPESIAIARQFVAEHPDLVQELRTGKPQKPAAPAQPEPTAAPATESRPAAARAPVPTLDEIAQGEGKPFAKLSAADQERVRNIRDAMERAAAGTTEAPAPRPAAPVARPTPVEPAAPRGKTAAEQLAEEIAAKRASLAQQTPAEAQAAFEQAKAAKTIPVQQGEAPAQVKADFEARQRPQAEAPPAAPPVSAPAAAQNLSDLMAGELPKVEQPGRSMYTETGELKSAKLRGQEIKLRNIEAKAQRFSDALTAFGMDPADVAKVKEGWVTAEAMKAGSPPGWENVMHDLIAKGLLDKAEKRAPSESVPRIVELMQQKQIAQAPKPAAPQNLSELMKPPKPRKKPARKPRRAPPER